MTRTEKSWRERARLYRPVEAVPKGVAREIMRKVYKSLRLKGFITRMNFRDCSTCGCSDLSKLAEKKVAEGMMLRFASFWHNQDEEYYWEDGLLYIRFFVLDKEDVVGTEAAGRLIANELKKHSAVFEWDGDPNRTIMVYENRETKKYLEERSK
jgi:hypothetical protein